MTQKKQQLSFIGLGLVCIALLYLLSEILTPFLISLLLAYLANPLVKLLTRCRLPRLLSVVVVFAFLFLVLLIIVLLMIPVIQKQADAFINMLPTILDWFQNTALPWASDFLGTPQIDDIASIKTMVVGNISKAGGVASTFFITILHSGIAVAQWILNIILIPVVTFYLLRDWDFIIKRLHKLLPKSHSRTLVTLVKECDEVLSDFFRGQLLVMLSLGFFYAIALTVLGLKIGLILGLIVGFISIVPYLGMIVGIVVASISAYIQFGTFISVMEIGIVFAIGQSLESMLLTPILVGDRIGLHPIAVIFAILAGGSLFGFFGVLLALPVAAVIMVGLRFLYRHYYAKPLT